MTQTKPIVYLLALVMLLITPAAAHAGDALPELKGAWVVETSKGAPPPEGVTMTMTFEDDSKMIIEASHGDKKNKVEVKYEATKDGKLTIYAEPETKPEGEKATWEIKDQKLHLTNAENEVLVLVRKS